MTKDVTESVKNTVEGKPARVENKAKKVVTRAKKTITVRNNMRCRWRVPPQLAVDPDINMIKDLVRRKEIIGALRKTLHPNETFAIDRGAFNKYYKGCRAFRAMIELKHIETDLKEVPEALLTSIKPPEPPAILKHPTPNAKMMVEKGNVDPMHLMKGMMQ